MYYYAVDDSQTFNISQKQFGNNLKPFSSQFKNMFKTSIIESSDDKPIIVFLLFGFIFTSFLLIISFIVFMLLFGLVSLRENKSLFLFCWMPCSELFCLMGDTNTDKWLVILRGENWTRCWELANELTLGTTGDKNTVLGLVMLNFLLNWLAIFSLSSKLGVRTMFAAFISFRHGRTVFTNIWL